MVSCSTNIWLFTKIRSHLIISITWLKSHTCRESNSFTFIIELFRLAHLPYLCLSVVINYESIIPVTLTFDKRSHAIKCNSLLSLIVQSCAIIMHCLATPSVFFPETKFIANLTLHNTPLPHNQSWLESSLRPFCHLFLSLNFNRVLYRPFHPLTTLHLPYIISSLLPLLLSPFTTLHDTLSSYRVYAV